MNQLEESAQTLLLIDSNAIIHRAFHAYPLELKTKDGQFTNAAFGFSVILLETLKKLKPDFVVCAIDEGRITFRHEQFAEYKAHRKPMADELAQQFPLVREIIRAFNIPLIGKEGYEADDVIGTIVKMPELHGLRKVVVTGDQDILQLIDDKSNVAVYLSGSTYAASKLYTEREVQERYGFSPLQIIDYKALLGDASDNIPGVPGIGKKGATDLIREFGGIEQAYTSLKSEDNRWQEKPLSRLRQKLADGEDSARKSYSLASIHTEVPINFNLEDCRLTSYDPQTVKELFSRLEFKSLINRLPASDYDGAEDESAQTAGQLPGQIAGQLPEQSRGSGIAKSLAKDSPAFAASGKSASQQLPFFTGPAGLTESPGKIDAEDVPMVKDLRKVGQVFTDLVDALEFINRALEAGVVAFDSETEVDHFMQAKLLGVGLAFGEDFATEVGFISAELLKESTVFEALAKVFAPLYDNSEDDAALLIKRTKQSRPHEVVHGSDGSDGSSGSAKILPTKFIAHNLKFDLHALITAGIIPADKVGKLSTIQCFDSLIAVYLIQAGEGGLAGRGLKDLAVKYLGWDMVKLTDLVGGGPVKDLIGSIATEDLGHYCCADAVAAWKLARVFDQELEQDAAIKQLFYTLEMPLVATLLRMERVGIDLDLKSLKQVGREIQSSLEKLTKEIYDLAGVEFNIGSPKQVAQLLFDKLKVQNDSGLEVPKTKSGAFSTDERTLMNFARYSPIVEKILEHRQLTKLVSTYIQGLEKQILSDGKLHTTYNQAVASTGRLSSTDPNLQNIPISSELGNRIRAAFKAGQGRELFAFDYAQQELRLLAALSGEQVLIDAFATGTDIHALTASQILQVPLDQISSEQRRIGKTVNFGIVYGMSGFGLSDRLKIDPKEAQQFINSFFDRYPRIREYFAAIKTQARSTGAIYTILGRRRDASALQNGNFRVRGAVERELINFPLQGGAADIMKLAMLYLDYLLFVSDDQLIRSEVEKASPGEGHVSVVNITKIVKTLIIHLQVHDELVMSLPVSLTREQLESISDIIKKLVSGLIDIGVPLLVDTERGVNWQEMVKI